MVGFATSTLDSLSVSRVRSFLFHGQTFTSVGVSAEVFTWTI